MRTSFSGALRRAAPVLAGNSERIQGARPPATSLSTSGDAVVADAARQRGDLVSDLYEAHAVTLVRTAKLLLGDQATAEDVVQDAFLGLYRALPRLVDHNQILPYLRAAVINGSRSVLRARRRAVLRRAQHEPPASSAELTAIDGEDRRAVLAAVARLPSRAREVLVLRYYLDLRDQEIASVLGVSRGTVSSTASRGLAALARELGEES
jgi:RNA polymerase sigma-70 factor (sigma-E family)